MRFDFLRYFYLLLFLLTTAASAQSVEKRVLFIVESSKDTKSLAEAERKLVGALVQTGLGGLMENNDTFAIWTFNETLQVGKFPMQRWTPETSNKLALRAQDFLKAQPHEKTPRIQSLSKPLQSVIRNSPALMVVLVTTGKQPISGTPFDAEINSQLKSALREYQRKKTPAVIMLSATSGEIIRYSVNPAIGDVKIPVLTMPTNIIPEIKLAQPAPAKKTNAVPAPIKTVTEPAPKPRTDTSLVITREGARNVSSADADRIADENIARLRPVPPEIEKLKAQGGEIKGPVLFNFDVQVVKEPALLIVPPQDEPRSDVQAQVAPVETKVQPEATPVAAREPEPIEVKVAESVTPALVQEPVKPEPVVSKLIASEPSVAVAKTSPTELIHPVREPEPKPLVTGPTMIVPDSAIPQPIQQEPPAQIAATPEKQPESTATTAAINPTAEPQPMLAQAAPVSNRSLPFLLGAMGLIFVAVVLAYLIGRQTSKRPQQSLVSDWAERDRVKK